jgi:hypothetical protein
MRRPGLGLDRVFSGVQHVSHGCSNLADDIAIPTEVPDEEEDSTRHEDAEVNDYYLVECPRCGARGNEPPWSLSVKERTDDIPWLDLCADCYRIVLGREPPEQFARENLKKLWRRRGLI